MKIFKRVLLITFIVYHCLILSLYIFPSSKMRVKDVVDVNWLFVSPGEHIMLSTPIKETPSEKPDWCCVYFSSTAVTFLESDNYYGSSYVVVGDKLYDFKYDESWRHDLVWYDTNTTNPWWYSYYTGFKKLGDYILGPHAK